MATQYDDIAEQYRRSKHVIWWHHIEQYSLFELLGDLRGKSVLDLACGEGHYTRLLKVMGAARVVGVDISPGMIALAEKSERDQPLGVEYLVASAQELELSERFDLVVAAYLLNYASSKLEILAMCQALSRLLKPGGRFVTVNNSPLQDVSQFQATRKYGFVKSVEQEITEGTAICYTFFLDDETFNVENYHLDAATYEWALQAAGLIDIQWQAMKLSPAEHLNYEYWADFFQDPPVILLQCSKGTAAATT